MSVEKMKLLSITGREENIDMFIEEYLLDSGLQTEDAVKVFEKGWNLTNFRYDSTAAELSKSCKAILDKYKIKYVENQEAETMKYSLEDLKQEFDTIKESFEYLIPSIIFIMFLISILIKLNITYIVLISNILFLNTFLYSLNKYISISCSTDNSPFSTFLYFVFDNSCDKS